MNNVSLTGRLTREPELRYGGQDNSTAITRFTLAVDDGKDTDFINIKCFGRTAEWAQKWLSKGSKAEVTGKIKTGSYESQRTGSKVYYTEVVANNVGFGESKAEAEARGQQLPESDGVMNIPEGAAEDITVTESEVQNMEQEETKTTAAAGGEMPPEAESWVQLHESELTELMQKQAKAAITELKRQEKQERKKEKYHNTFTLMKCYRDMAFHIENAISDGQQLELKGMTDEQQRTYLESIRRTRFKTLIMTAHIDKAVEEIERRREAAGRGVEYKAFEMYFMQGMDYAEIAEELDTGKNTPRRWVTGIINELSVLLWGIDEERVK